MLRVAQKDKVEPAKPSATQDLIDLYDLKTLAASVARQDPVTGAKRKLRKSYKNHIADLPGKHVIPEPGEPHWSLVDFARNPPQGSVLIEPLAPDLLAQLKFEKSSADGIPGFDARLLGAPAAPSEDYSIPVSMASPKDKRKRAVGKNSQSEKRIRLQFV